MCVCVCLFVFHIYIYINVYIYIYIYLLTYLFIYLFVYMWISICLENMYIYIYMYADIWIHMAHVQNDTIHVIFMGDGKMLGLAYWGWNGARKNETAMVPKMQINIQHISQTLLYWVDVGELLLNSKNHRVTQFITLYWVNCMPYDAICTGLHSHMDPYSVDSNRIREAVLRLIDWCHLPTSDPKVGRRLYPPVSNMAGTSHVIGGFRSEKSTISQMDFPAMFDCQRLM